MGSLRIRRRHRVLWTGRNLLKTITILEMDTDYKVINAVLREVLDSPLHIGVFQYFIIISRIHDYRFIYRVHSSIRSIS
jgi:hypothetical protein